jgi:hypothetical protein
MVDIVLSGSDTQQMEKNAQGVSALLCHLYWTRSRKTGRSNHTMATVMIFQNLQIEAQKQLLCGGVTIIRQVSTTTAVAAGQQTEADWHIPIAKAYGHVSLEDPAGAIDLWLHL